MTFAKHDILYIFLSNVVRMIMLVIDIGRKLMRRYKTLVRKLQSLISGSLLGFNRVPLTSSTTIIFLPSFNRSNS